MQTFYSTLSNKLVGWYYAKRGSRQFSTKHFDFACVSCEYRRQMAPFRTGEQQLSVEYANTLYERAMLISSGALPSEL